MSEFIELTEIGILDKPQKTTINLSLIANFFQVGEGTRILMNNEEIIDVEESYSYIKDILGQKITNRYIKFTKTGV